jgi:hypothetical protein
VLSVTRKYAASKNLVEPTRQNLRLQAAFPPKGARFHVG